MTSWTTTITTTMTVECDKKAPSAPLEDSSRRLCVENPYQSSFLDSLDEIAQCAKACWICSQIGAGRLATILPMANTVLLVSFLF